MKIATASRAALAALAWASAGVAAEPLRISVASSLEPAICEAAAVFAAEHGESLPLIHAAASGVLLQQARRAAPADLLISASPAEIDRLVVEDLALPETRRRLGSNRLVVATACGAAPIRALDELRAAAYDRIAVGNPRTAPLGRYTRQALERAGLWGALASRALPAENARQALDYVARGEAPAGIVYLTDVRLLAGRVCPALEIPDELHDTIAYEGVVLRDAAAPATAGVLLDWLVSAPGQAILSGHGFLPPRQ